MLGSPRWGEATGPIGDHTLPPHLRHVKRLPAVRRHHGPLRPTRVQRERIALRSQIDALRKEGAPWCP